MTHVRQAAMPDASAQPPLLWAPKPLAHAAHRPMAAACRQPITPPPRLGHRALRQRFPHTTMALPLQDVLDFAIDLAKQAGEAIVKGSETRFEKAGTHTPLTYSGL